MLSTVHKNKRGPQALRGRLLFLLLIPVLFAGGCVSGKVVRVPDMSQVEVPEIVEGIAGARVVFVGEVHDHRDHHRLQLDVIRSLHENGLPVAVGLEMFGVGSQKELDRWVDGELGELGLKKVYYSQWHIPWRQYKHILRYARDNRIPLVAINVSRALIKKVFKEGAAALSGEEAEGLAGIECDVDPEYEELIRDAMGEHKDLEDSYKRFCETQMVWDMAMARSIVRYLKDNPGRIMVVLTGSAHAWRRGIARQMQKLPSGAEYMYVVIIPEIPGKLDRTNIKEGDTDYLLLDTWMSP